MLDIVVNYSEMILDQLKNWTEFLGANPRSIFGIVFGLLISWGGTQTVKRVYQWHGEKVRIFAFVVGFIVCFTSSTVSVSVYSISWMDLWTSIAVGLFSPSAYDLTRSLLRRKYPWIDNLSNTPKQDKKP